MLKFAILLSIFFNNAYAYAGFIAPIARQAYAGSGLTDEQIFEDERMWSVKKQTNTMKMLENPEKKPSDPEVMPGVIKSKISTENLFSYCHGRVFKREQVKLVIDRRKSKIGQKVILLKKSNDNVTIFQSLKT